jgi:hypothetical protein
MSSPSDKQKHHHLGNKRGTHGIYGLGLSCFFAARAPKANYIRQSEINPPAILNIHPLLLGNKDYETRIII